MRPVRELPVDAVDALLRDALRARRLSGTALQIAISFVGICKRGRSPSERHEAAARRILTELRRDVDGPLLEPLIDGGA